MSNVDNKIVLNAELIKKLDNKFFTDFNFLSFAFDKQFRLGHFIRIDYINALFEKIKEFETEIGLTQNNKLLALIITNIMHFNKIDDFSSFLDKHLVNNYALQEDIITLLKNNNQYLNNAHLVKCFLSFYLTKGQYPCFVSQPITKESVALLSSFLKLIDCVDMFYYLAEAKYFSVYASLNKCFALDNQQMIKSYLLSFLKDAIKKYNSNSHQRFYYSEFYQVIKLLNIKNFDELFNAQEDKNAFLASLLIQGYWFRKFNYTFKISEQDVFCALNYLVDNERNKNLYAIYERNIVLKVLLKSENKHLLENLFLLTFKNRTSDCDFMNYFNSITLRIISSKFNPSLTLDEFEAYFLIKSIYESKIIASPEAPKGSIPYVEFLEKLIALKPSLLSKVGKKHLTSHLLLIYFENVDNPRINLENYLHLIDKEIVKMIFKKDINLFEHLIKLEDKRINDLICLEEVVDFIIHNFDNKYYHYSIDYLVKNFILNSKIKLNKEQALFIYSNLDTKENNLIINFKMLYSDYLNDDIDNEDRMLNPKKYRLTKQEFNQYFSKNPSYYIENIDYEDVEKYLTPENLMPFLQ